MIRALTSAALLPALSLFSACEKRQTSDTKVHVTYWEKWTGAEGEAMRRTVDKFNSSQNRIVVEYLNVSQVDRKTLLATSGGDPPDIAGIWPGNLYSFSDCNALTPLDDFIREDGVTAEQWLARYVPVFADLVEYRGHVWGIPSTPSVTALHWNKSLFRAAGLDPERPPRTLAELREFSDKLTIRDANGAIRQIGFLPQQPTWWSWAYPAWFGGEIFDGREITAGTRPQNVAAYQWLADWTRHYGLDSVKAFTSGFGNFSSPQDPFFSGQVAMTLQGVFLNNFIRQYAPGMDYGVAGWPEAQPGVSDFTLAEADALAIPRGAKHAREAWQFLKYIASSNPNAQSFDELSGIELLCFLQEKNSPLRQWSPFFEMHHPHPQIAFFRKLAESPHAVHSPKMGIWDEYWRELGTTFDIVRLLIKPPEDALAFLQRRMSDSWQWHRESLDRREALARK